MRMASV